MLLNISFKGNVIKNSFEPQISQFTVLLCLGNSTTSLNLTFYHQEKEVKNIKNLALLNIIDEFLGSFSTIKYH